MVKINQNNILFLLSILIPISLIIGTLAVNLILLFFFLFFIFKIKFFFRYQYNLGYIKYFYFFCFYLIINSLLSYNLVPSLERSFFYFRYIIFFTILIYYFEQNSREDLFKKNILVWNFIFFFLSLDLIFQSYFGFNITGHSTNVYGRNSSFFYDELKAGGFIFGLGYLFISLYYYYFKDKKITLLLLLLITIACFLTGERSNTIKSLILFFFMTVMILKPLNKKKIIIFFLTLIFSVMIVPKLNKNVTDRLINFNHFGDYKKNNYIDKYLSTQWGSHAVGSYLIFKDNLLFGVGNKNFRYVCNKYESVVKQDYNTVRTVCSTHPHQIYYELLSEHGLVGFIVILFIFFYIIYDRSKNKLNIINLTALMYLIITFLPLLPSGSFFNSDNSLVLWFNMTCFIYNFKKINE